MSDVHAEAQRSRRRRRRRFSSCPRKSITRFFATLGSMFFFLATVTKKKKAFILPSGIHISEVSKPPPDKGGILTRLTSPSLTCTHSSRPQRDTSGVLVENPPAGGVSSLQSMPPPSPPPHTRSFLACCLAFSLCSPPPPSHLFHLAQWRSAISATLTQSQPACRSRRDATPTAIPSPLITWTWSRGLFC